MAERDWARIVAEEQCAECGFDGAAVERAAIGKLVISEGEQWALLLQASADTALRRRPATDRWSALEYACHVRDVLGVFTSRIEQARVEFEPEFGWWDHERAAIDEHYNDQEPVEVAIVIGERARELAQRLGRLTDAEWSRTGTRRGTEHFTIEGLARFSLHEIRHHLADARAQIA